MKVASAVALHRLLQPMSDSTASFGTLGTLMQLDFQE
jgi:hypothetical protein